MRTALQVIISLIVGLAFVFVFTSCGDSGSARRPATDPSAVGQKAGDGVRLWIDPWFGAVVALALLVFWMVMAWRAVRALESIAGSLRGPAGAPDAPPPAAEE